MRLFILFKILFTTRHLKRKEQQLKVNTQPSSPYQQVYAIRLQIEHYCINLFIISVYRQLMFENIENGQVAALSPHTQKTIHSTKSKPIPTPLKQSPPNHEKRLVKRLGPYEFSMDQRIGSGMTGDAYVGINTQTNELVCIKIIDRSVFKTSNEQLLLDNEIRCQQACRSNYTVRIYDIFDTNSFCFIVTEFCQSGDLYRFLRSTPNGLPQQEVIRLGKQIALALKKLKDANIVHRDIKSENILIQKGHCKLGDFGFAIEQKKLSSEHKFNLGSPLYMSIEALQTSIYSFSSDVFSYGVVLYEMLHRQSPWECSDEKELLQKMKTQEAAFKSGLKQQLKELISLCLSKKSEDRPSIQQILANPIFK